MMLPSTLDSGINIYSEQDLEKLKIASSVGKSIMNRLKELAVPGATTQDIELEAESLIKSNKCEPLFKGYEEFPFCTCLSNNDKIVHGLASDEPLKEGDVLTIDLGLKFEGFCSDHARTVIVGNATDSPHRDLVECAEGSFFEALKYANPGNTTGDIAFAVNKKVLSYLNVPNNYRSGMKFQICPNFQGHGIGLELHEEPSVPNVGLKGKGIKLLPGMCICIEPVVLYRTSNVINYLQDGVHQFKTHDAKPAAHYENQIYISETGPIVLTL